jgi:hypothetical protein
MSLENSKVKSFDDYSGLVQSALYEVEQGAIRKQIPVISTEAF